MRPEVALACVVCSLPYLALRLFVISQNDERKIMFQKNG